jgi:phenylpropionate dioxygenase-like ring-hydroxylating dioxygenase large terminal subunit
MTIADFTFETDLAAAATIPSGWYRDPGVLALEQDRIFARTWQLVGHSEQVALPGDYFTCAVADEPLVVTRADDGSLHAFSNVCRHRARGRYSVLRENGVHHFHELLTRALR